MSLSTSIGRRRAGVVIAGGGLAAQRASETLRRNGYDGAVRVIAREPHAPYDRPPLSKAFLAGPPLCQGEVRQIPLLDY